MSKTNYFQNIKTLSDLKKEYFKLAKVFHPDRGGSLEKMQELNNEYDYMFDILKNSIDYNKFKESENSDFSACNYTYKQETSNIFKDIIQKIIHLDDIEMEICGYWLWISGNTRPYKDHLKENGFKWSPKKYMWYWRPEEYARFGNRKSFSMDDIRLKYGSNIIKPVSIPKIDD